MFSTNHNQKLELILNLIIYAFQKMTVNDLCSSFLHFFCYKFIKTNILQRKEEVCLKLTYFFLNKHAALSTCKSKK